MRLRALMVVVGVVMIPIIWVWMLELFDQSFARLRNTAKSASDEAGLTLDFDNVAKRHGVRIRIIAIDEVIEYDIDRVRLHPWYQRVKDPFYGPEGPPDPRKFDAELELSVRDRTEIKDARANPGDIRYDCRNSRDDKLVGCSAASVLDDGRLLYVQAYFDHLFRSLHDDRWPITAMLFVVLAFGILAAIWLGWRMVAPLEFLRDQVVARTEGKVSTEPIFLDRTDEIGDLANAFNQLLAALAARNKSNEVFAADLAHELKNPVAALRAAAEAMASDKPIEGARKERLQRVLAEASQRMDTAISGFLDLARAESGLIASDREPIELGQLTRAIVASTEADPRNSGLIFEVHGDSAQIDAAPERLETALRNLVGNASSFATKHVTIYLRDEPGLAIVQVCDDGPGIADEDLDRVFDRYFSKRKGGTGLGLALTKAIVEAHGGSIKVRSDKGACFEVQLRR